MSVDEGVTSIINMLETGNFETINKTSLNRLKYLENSIQETQHWLKMNHPVLLGMKNNEYYKYMHTLLNLKTQVETTVKDSSIKKDIYMRKKRGYTITCPVCNISIYVKPGNKNFWDIIQSHEHFEFKICNNLCRQELVMKNTDKFRNLPLVSKCRNSDRKLNKISNTNIEHIPSHDYTTWDCTWNHNELSPFTGFKQINVNSSFIKDQLYPYSVMSQVYNLQNNYKLRSVMAITDIRFCCLLCFTEVFRDHRLFSHLVSKQHQKNLRHKTVSEMVKKFHDFFSCMPTSIQVHQVAFVPIQTKMMYCKLCFENVYKIDFVDHITNQKHINLLLKANRLKEVYFRDEMIFSLQDYMSEEGRQQIVNPVIQNSDSKPSMWGIKQSCKQNKMMLGNEIHDVDFREKIKREN